MNRTIGATEGALRRGAEAVAGAHADVADSTARIQEQLEEVKRLWRGDAAKAYGRMLDTWIDDAAKLNAVLVDLENALRQAEADRVAREAANQAVIAGLGGPTIDGLGSLMKEA